MICGAEYFLKESRIELFRRTLRPAGRGFRQLKVDPDEM